MFISVDSHTDDINKQDSKTIEQNEEWESKTVILEIGGIMDVNAARQALNRGDSAIRRCNTENPILQISNSLFTTEWNSIIGTDMIFKLEEKQLRFVECSDVRLKAEKALIIDNDDNSMEIVILPSIFEKLDIDVDKWMI
ncbi:unnamed protein product [Onchocerca flexuosa]|uniref:TFIIIC_sub6 domain-containing protein n=1 Tax=Onchocerca flexuosa TaxID=387005 RepID=A0A183H622_9BILA|nr:unnamed protein product [Onchocerca flexuosa]